MVTIKVLSVEDAEGAKGKYIVTLSMTGTSPDGTEHEERKNLLLFRYFCQAQTVRTQIASLPATGAFLSQEECDALLLADEASRAAVKAVGILAYGDQTAKRLSDKLRAKGFSREACDQALRYVLDKRYIREDEQLDHFMHVLCETKHYGLRRIRQEVYARGFSEQTIRLWFSSVAESLDFDAALEKRLEKVPEETFSDPDKVQRLTASLLRYGFSTDEIRRGLRNKG